MPLLLSGVAVLLLGSVAALLARRNPRLSTSFGLCSAVSGAVLGLIPAFDVLLSGTQQTFRCAWSVPYGTFFIGLDPLSAFFIVIILSLTILTAIYGSAYLSHYSRTGVPPVTEQASVPPGQAGCLSHALGVPWFFFNWLVAAMVLVVMARNGVLFLMAWEIMSLTSFFLVTFEDEKESVRQAGWIYLVAAHLGVAFLLVLFVLLGAEGGSLDFDRIHVAPQAAGLLFILAVIGFGSKAGFVPFHVWLPEAHPAAPSHVSALMSGVMIKLGIYGLIRTLLFLGPPPAWWGGVLIGIGVSSGILGVLFALAQQDLKRLLAYSSVENIGIIALGLGLGLLGQSYDMPVLTVLGFAGALWHVLNHALFKSLLFLCAGTVLHATGTGDLERLGGLLKRLPWTGAAFLAGSVAICGLPPFNGFCSEFLIYLGAYSGTITHGGYTAFPLVAVILALALIGGLAAACFTRAFGIVFLGEPRSDAGAAAHEVSWAMRGPVWILAAACLAVGLLSPLVLNSLQPLLQQVTHLQPHTVEANLADTGALLTCIVWAGGAFIAILAALALLRWALLRSRSVTQAPTWDCGYARPTARMQYTASSFAAPLVALFWPFLRTHRLVRPPAGLFPAESRLATETPDPCQEYFYTPLFESIAAFLYRLRWLQHGRVQFYVLYIAVTLLALLLWKLN